MPACVRRAFTDVVGVGRVVRVGLLDSFVWGQVLPEEGLSSGTRATWRSIEVERLSQHALDYGVFVCAREAFDDVSNALWLGVI